MFGFVKKWLSGGGKTAPPGAPPAQETPSRPVVGPGRPASVAAHPYPKPAPAQAPAAALEAADSATAAPGILRLPLKVVLGRLPAHIQSQIKHAPSADVEIQLPLDFITQQLARGSVKLSFAQLKEASPPDLFLSSKVEDNTLLPLPLDIIVPRLPPAYMNRRPGQTKVTATIDAGPVFGTKSKASTSHEVAHEPVSASMVNPEPQAAVPPPPPPAPEAPQPIPATGLPPATAPHPAYPRKEIPIPSFAKPFRPPAPAILPSSFSLPRPAMPPPPPLPPLQLRTPVAPLTSAPPPAPAENFVVVNIASLSSGWPRPVQDELVRFNLAQAEVSLPVAQVASALKTGQFTLTWKQLCGWIKPPLPTAATVTPPETPLKLPLQAIVPRFMAQQKPEKPKPKVTVADHIPDVFHGIAPAPATPAEVAPLPAPEEAAYPSAETAASAGPPALAERAPAFDVIAWPPPPPELAPAVRDLQRLFKQPTQDNWTPAELVEELAKMPGVGGALIAMPDGLLVANRSQPNLNGDMLAAFLPQLFGRLEQYAKELKWGEIRSLNFEVDNMAVHIFNVGYVYFTVLGRAGEDLPLTSIKAVAAYLAQPHTHH